VAIDDGLFESCPNPGSSATDDGMLDDLWTIGEQVTTSGSPEYIISTVETSGKFVFSVRGYDAEPIMLRLK
jgi:hypothetical protein